MNVSRIFIQDRRPFRGGKLTLSGPCRAVEGEVNTLVAMRNSVELDGIEPTTSGLQSQRSPN